LFVHAIIFFLAIGKHLSVGCSYYKLLLLTCVVSKNSIFYIKFEYYIPTCVDFVLASFLEMQSSSLEKIYSQKILKHFWVGWW